MKIEKGFWDFGPPPKRAGPFAEGVNSPAHEMRPAEKVAEKSTEGHTGGFSEPSGRLIEIVIINVYRF